MKRATDKPFMFRDLDPHMRGSEAYKNALRQLHLDACNNYGGEGRTERGLLLSALACGALKCNELVVPYVRGADTVAFHSPASKPSTAGHYANLIDDLAEYAETHLFDRGPEDVGFGSLPYTLRMLSRDIRALAELERRPPEPGADILPFAGPTRIATERGR